MSDNNFDLNVLLTSVIVSLQIPGIHRWKNCSIDQVSYLRDYHRHVFHIKMQIPVEHDDRDVEIIRTKVEAQKWLFDTYSNPNYPGHCFFDNLSCEQIAKIVGDRFCCSRVEVLEDGENGAVVDFITPFTQHNPQQ